MRKSITFFLTLFSLLLFSLEYFAFSQDDSERTIIKRLASQESSPFKTMEEFDQYVQSAITSNSVPFILTLFENPDSNVQIRMLFEILKSLCAASPDFCVDYDLDTFAIQFIEENEITKSIDHEIYASIQGAQRLLGTCRTDDSLSYLLERCSIEYWETKPNLTFEKTGKLCFDTYRRDMRDSCLNAIGYVDDEKNEEYLHAFHLNANDPDYKRLRGTINHNHLRTMKEKARQSQKLSKLAKAYRDIHRITAAIEAYKIDHKKYPANLNKLLSPRPYLDEIPQDIFRSNEIYDYSPSEQGFAIRSAGKNGKIDSDTKNGDDIVLKFD